MRNNKIECCQRNACIFIFTFDAQALNILNLPFYIARRYFLSKKSQHAINIISWVSMAGIAVGTAGLIIVLSVFNGFSNLITGLYNVFDPDLKISVKEGKSFSPSEIDFDQIKKTEGIKYVCFSYEEQALVKYRDRQVIATIKGVDENFIRTSRVTSHIVDGEFLLEEENKNFSVIGSELAYQLDINLEDVFSTLNMYVPKKGIDFSLVPEEAFTNLVASPSGVFAIQQDFDSKYLITSIDFAHELAGETGKITSAEISLDNNYDPEQIQEKIKKITGEKFMVANRIQQHSFLERIFKSEKAAIFLILGFILLISAFSIIGSMSMLIIDKRQDIATMMSFGATTEKVRNIFFIEGIMLSLAGGITGLFVGGIICALQQKFKLIRISNSESFIIDAYPVYVETWDFIFVLLTIATIGFLLAKFSAYLLVKNEKIIPVKA